MLHDGFNVANSQYQDRDVEYLKIIAYPVTTVASSAGAVPGAGKRLSNNKLSFKNKNSHHLKTTNMSFNTFRQQISKTDVIRQTITTKEGLSSVHHVHNNRRRHDDHKKSPYSQSPRKLTTLRIVQLVYHPLAT